jgi:antitoxin ParD1/3/4
MPPRKTLNVSLTPVLQKFVEKKVASGLYQTASEVVRDGLRLLEERERANDRDLESVRRKIAVGLRQAKVGKLVDGSKAFAELRAEISGDRKRRKAG